jgi:asparagine synthase (glutamine-hydrolysing)
MCGFSGVAQIGGGVDSSVVQRMGDSLFHRGPDQAGTYVWAEGGLGVGLATRRLAILDLSPAGSQPMLTTERSLCIAYNGELYNEPELRHELEAQGHRYRSRSDTETVLYAYQAHGPGVFNRLDGMFALAIHDRRKGQLVLARDRMGIKPLYYSWDGGSRLTFASELRTLVAHGGAPAVVDSEGLELYLACGYVPSPYALIRGVRKLPPGSYLTLNAAGKLEIHHFWTPACPTPAKLSRAAAEEVVRGAIHDAVGRQMRSDVPVGVLLSGGVDSTIIATAAAARTDRPLDTFSIEFRSSTSPIEEVYNADARFARRVADTLGATHHEVTCDDGDDLPELLRRLVVGLDEPVWELSFVSIYLMSRLARQNGVKVLLTGDGSDELFAGYGWIAGAWRQEQYERLPFLPALLPLLARLAPAESSVRVRALDLQAILGKTDVARYDRSRTMFNRAERAALLGRQGTVGGYGPLAGVLKQLLAGAVGRSRADRVALLDLALWVREHFNQRLDRMTMLNSVEARVPFQDNQVVDLALRLPFLTKAWAGRPKKLLKDAFRGEIPEFVLRRPKRPFAAPMGAWHTGALRAFAREMLAEERLRAMSLIDPAAARRALAINDPVRQDGQTSRLWTLVMLQLWAEGLHVSGASCARESRPSSAPPRAG